MDDSGRRRNDLGPAGYRVSRAVRRLREEQGLSLVALSERLERLGRPIAPLSLGRIEDAANEDKAADDRRPRRVDVDDLIALALALEVTPNALMMPAPEEIGAVALTTQIEGSNWELAWRWAAGEAPSVRWDGEQISGLGADDPEPPLSWIQRWFERTRPYESKEELNQRTMSRDRQLMARLRDKINSLKPEGDQDGER